VNEALIRLFKADALSKAPNRRYLFAAAATAMRRVLIEHARRRKRMSGLNRVPLDEAIILFEEEQKADILALDEAIDRLTDLNERQGLVVVLRYFVGLSIRDVADVLDVSTTTVETDWRIARAWLHSELGGSTR
jgi:RNA polymerase sigma-70 factor, ECF subfamily